MPVLVALRLFVIIDRDGWLRCIRSVWLPAMTRADKETLIEIVKALNLRA